MRKRADACLDKNIENEEREKIVRESRIYIKKEGRKEGRKKEGKVCAVTLLLLLLLLLLLFAIVSRGRGAMRAYVRGCQHSSFSPFIFREGI